MHEDLMKFPNRMFYNDSLSVIEKIERLTQNLPFESKDDHLTPLRRHRLIFIPTSIEEGEMYFKTNNAESFAVSRLLPYY